MTLQGFAFGSAADVLDDDAGEEALAVAGEADLVEGDAEEEGDGGDVGFGFGDGYDLGSAACESSLKSASNGGGAGVAIEADIGEVGVKGGVGTEREGAERFVEVSSHIHAAATGIDGGGVVERAPVLSIVLRQAFPILIQPPEGEEHYGRPEDAPERDEAAGVVAAVVEVLHHIHEEATDTALFRNPNYHKHTDTVDTLDFDAMASITENLVSALARFAG